MVIVTAADLSADDRARLSGSAAILDKLSHDLGDLPAELRDIFTDLGTGTR